MDTPPRASEVIRATATEYGNYSGHDGLYRACGGPVAERSERFAEWETKEELKAHKIELCTSLDSC